MNPDRLKLLQDLMATQPQDPFYAYALALEIAQETPEEAILALCTLRETHETYLPLYYQLAKLLLMYSQIDAAKECILRGIDLAQVQQELKTKRELEALLEELD